MASKYDIDTYLNPLIPRNLFRHLPQPISHVFGYRPPHSNPAKPHVLLVWAFTFIGAFLGVALIEVVYLHLPVLSGHHVPIVIASFGAAAILEYNTIESPLAQPRNLVFGHFLAALIGVSITKLFHLLAEQRFEQLRWLAGALAVGTASVVMSMTKTVHPPAGATALLTATSADITDLGWWTLALVLLGCMLMLTSALIINNIVRQFPMYWWTPVGLGAMRKVGKSVRDIEQAKAQVLDLDDGNDDEPMQPQQSHSDTGADTLRGSTDTMQKEESGMTTALGHELTVARDRVSAPEWLQLSDYENEVLQILQQKLVEGPA